MSDAQHTFTKTRPLAARVVSCALAATFALGCGREDRPEHDVGADGDAAASEDAGSGDRPANDSGSSGGSDGSDGASDVDSGTDDDAGLPPPPAGPLDPSLPPGGNFDLSIWLLEEPVGSPGAPTRIPPSKLVGPNGYSDKYFFTDPVDGAMTFWDPENGVTTSHSNYPRSELREMTKSGAPANWLPPGNHTLSATLKATVIPDHTAVGQIHLGTGTPASTKPLLELFYYPSGKIELAIEQTPAGGNEIPHTVGTVALGKTWSYVLGLSGNTIRIAIDGGAAQTFAMSSTFDLEGMYFKAGNYDQSVGSDPNVSATVQFYALTVEHTP